MSDVLGRIKEKFLDKMLRLEERSQRRAYIDFKPQDIPEAVKFIFHELSCRLATVTGTDTPAGIEMLYHFSDDATGRVISLRALITDKKHPEIESITPITRGAEWIEREIWELLGVNFKAHPNLKHLLLVDEWPQGKYPLRHDHD